MSSSSFEDRFALFETLLVAAAHQVERAFARLRDARSHAGFQRLRARLCRASFLDFNVDFRGDRRAVDENLPRR